MPANESFPLQRLWGFIREQEFYICHSPAFSGITQSFYCVSKRRSICDISVFGEATKLIFISFFTDWWGRVLISITPTCRKQWPSLVLKDAPVTNGNILPYSSYISIPQKYLRIPAYGQQQSFDQVSKKGICRTGSHCVQRQLCTTLNEPGPWAGFEH